MVMTALQLLVGQAGIFTPKHQGNLRPLPRLFAGRHAALSRLQHRPGNMPIPRTGTHYQATTDKRLLKRGHNLRRIENISSAGGPGHRVFARKIPRINQHQLRQPHVFHGPRRATDIARMTGTDQHNANIFQQRKRSQTRL